MVDQYDKFYIPSIDMHVNGQLTLGENIADNGGLVEGFRAYRKNVEQSGKEELRLPGLEQVTPNQLYFINYAGVKKTFLINTHTHVSWRFLISYRRKLLHRYGAIR
jgi:predicted metalloendopeptidase